MADGRGLGQPWIYCKAESPSWHLDYNQGLSPHAASSFKTGNYKARMNPELSKHVTTYIANDPRETRKRLPRVEDVVKMMSASKSSMRRSLSASAISSKGDADHGNVTPSRSRQFHPTKCNVSMRLTEPEHMKPGGEVYNMWLCPGAGQPAHPWKARARDTPKVTHINSRPWSAP
mmetsp:Transcript_23475/g.61845  ORF Transcript_23475/g.61845 Transcript_23475/m.61845 type:complete len:175 (-) Transcript_23475:492-1016(-)